MRAQPGAASFCNFRSPEFAERAVEQARPLDAREKRAAELLFRRIEKQRRVDAALVARGQADRHRETAVLRAEVHIRKVGADIHRPLALLRMLLHGELRLGEHALQRPLQRCGVVRLDTQYVLGVRHVVPLHFRFRDRVDADVVRQAGVQLFDQLRVRDLLDQADVHRLAAALKAERKRRRKGQKHVRVEALRVPQRQLRLVERAGHAAVQVEMGNIPRRAGFRKPDSNIFSQRKALP